MINPAAGYVPISRIAIRYCVAHLTDLTARVPFPDLQAAVMGFRHAVVVYVHYGTCTNPSCAVHLGPTRYQMDDWIDRLPLTAGLSLIPQILDEHPDVSAFGDPVIRSVRLWHQPTRAAVRYYGALRYGQSDPGQEPIADVLGDEAPWVLTELGEDTSWWRPKEPALPWDFGARGFG